MHICLLGIFHISIIFHKHFVYVAQWVNSWELLLSRIIISVNMAIFGMIWSLWAVNWCARICTLKINYFIHLHLFRYRHTHISFVISNEFLRTHVHPPVHKSNCFFFLLLISLRFSHDLHHSICVLLHFLRFFFSHSFSSSWQFIRYAPSIQWRSQLQMHNQFEKEKEEAEGEEKINTALCSRAYTQTTFNYVVN